MIFISITYSKELGYDTKFFFSSHHHLSWRSHYMVTHFLLLVVIWVHPLCFSFGCVYLIRTENIFLVTSIGTPFQIPTWKENYFNIVMVFKAMYTWNDTRLSWYPFFIMDQVLWYVGTCIRIVLFGYNCVYFVVRMVTWWKKITFFSFSYLRDFQYSIQL